MLNHLGNVSEAKAIVNKQTKEISGLAANPELFHLVVDFKVLETEYYVNDMDLNSALALSRGIINLLDDYRGVWQILQDRDDIEEFTSSDFSIKSEMAFFRICILSIGFAGEHRVDQWIKRIELIEQFVKRSADESRLTNYKAMYFLKNGEPKKAASLLLASIEDRETQPGPYDIHMLLRAVNDVMLEGGNFDTAKVSSILEMSSSNTYATAGHPADIILREKALFEFQIGETSKAKKTIKKSVQLTNDGCAPLMSFLRSLTTLHEDLIFSRIDNEEKYFSELNSEFVAAISKVDKPTLLQRARYLSFY